MVGGKESSIQIFFLYKRIYIWYHKAAGKAERGFFPLLFAWYPSKSGFFNNKDKNVITIILGENLVKEEWKKKRNKQNTHPKAKHPQTHHLSSSGDQEVSCLLSCTCLIKVLLCYNGKCRQSFFLYKIIIKVFAGWAPDWLNSSALFSCTLPV